jgi:hypothetical protein
MRVSGAVATDVFAGESAATPVLKPVSRSASPWVRIPRPPPVICKCPRSSRNAAPQGVSVCRLAVSRVSPNLTATGSSATLRIRKQTADARRRTCRALQAAAILGLHSFPWCRARYSSTAARMMPRSAGPVAARSSVQRRNHVARHLHCHDPLDRFPDQIDLDEGPGRARRLRPLAPRSDVISPQQPVRDLVRAHPLEIRRPNHH